MDNSSDTVLTKKSWFSSRNHLPFQFFWQLFFYYITKTIPSDAESHESQDGSKQKFVGGTTAKLWPIFCQGVMENMEEKQK